MKKTDQWIPEYWNHSAMFSDHHRLIDTAIEGPHWKTWPNCNELNGLWPHKNKTLSGHITHFVPQSTLPSDAAFYEEHIFHHGEIPTRERNWHDFFNAQVWLQFPKTKSVLNAQHVVEIENQKQNNGIKNRNRKRDALTLFDESGIIFVSNDEQMIQALRSHEWTELFWNKRQQWWRSISVFILGHGLYEKALSPYIGMTGNTMSLLVDDDFFNQNRSLQIRQLDQRISDEILNENLLDLPSCLSPLPLLGIPTWWQENNRASFYDNKKYFRPKNRNKITPFT